MNDHRLPNSPPILIYQMGKVGSSSVYDTLKSAKFINPIYHIHSLNPNVLKQTREEYKLKKLLIPDHITAGLDIVEMIEKNGTNNWKIITIVRDLIKNKVSRFFQNIERYSFDYQGILNSNKEINTDVVLDVLNKNFSNFNENRDFICTWFDRELKIIFDIDIYDYSFDHHKGYTIINTDRVDILVLKTELLSATFTKAIKSFMNLDYNLTLLNSNASETKEYNESYRRVLKELIIPNHILNKIHSSKYMRHFYPNNV